VHTGIVVDDTFFVSPESNEVITLQDDGSVTLSRIDPTVSSKGVSSVKRTVETYLSGEAVDDGHEFRSPSASETHSSST